MMSKLGPDFRDGNELFHSGGVQRLHMFSSSLVYDGCFCAFMHSAVTLEYCLDVAIRTSFLNTDISGQESVTQDSCTES